MWGLYLLFRRKNTWISLQGWRHISSTPVTAVCIPMSVKRSCCKPGLVWKVQLNNKANTHLQVAFLLQKAVHGGSFFFISLSEVKSLSATSSYWWEPGCAEWNSHIALCLVTTNCGSGRPSQVVPFGLWGAVGAGSLVSVCGTGWQSCLFAGGARSSPCKDSLLTTFLPTLSSRKGAKWKCEVFKMTK